MTEEKTPSTDENGSVLNQNDCAFTLMRLMQEACIRSQNYGHKNIMLPMTFMGHQVEVNFKKIKSVEVTEAALMLAFVNAMKKVDQNQDITINESSLLYKEVKKELGL